MNKLQQAPQGYRQWHVLERTESCCSGATTSLQVDYSDIVLGEQSTHALATSIYLPTGSFGDYAN